MSEQTVRLPDAPDGYRWPDPVLWVNPSYNDHWLDLDGKAVRHGNCMGRRHILERIPQSCPHCGKELHDQDNH